VISGVRSGEKAADGTLLEAYRGSHPVIAGLPDAWQYSLPSAAPGSRH
jgi:hypothetical protein